jgi:uncharacterized protein
MLTRVVHHATKDVKCRPVPSLKSLEVKSSGFVIIISIVIGIYALANLYVFNRGLQALPSIFWVKAVYTVVFVALASAYLLSRSIERTNLFSLHHLAYWAGTMWLAVLLYLFIAVLFFDLLRLVNLGFHFLPSQDTIQYLQLKQITLAGTLSVIFMLLAYGKWNAAHPGLKKLEVAVHKHAGSVKQLNLVMVSDIHLGSLFGKRKVERMVESINALHPDLVLLVGDILDEAQNPIFHDNTGASLKNIQSALGVYAVTGNHEYIGGVNAAVKYLETLNVKFLRDTSELINNSFYLAGREDKDSGRSLGRERKTLSEVLNGINHQLPIILLDHQPYHLEEAQNNGVDLQLSGHTHNGQFWPFNQITKKVYEISWGYLQKGATHVYVSCGYGTWGPPVRVGNKPEIVQIMLRFD